MFGPPLCHLDQWLIFYWPKNFFSGQPNFGPHFRHCRFPGYIKKIVLHLAMMKWSIHRLLTAKYHCGTSVIFQLYCAEWRNENDCRVGDNFLYTWRCSDNRVLFLIICLAYGYGFCHNCLKRGIAFCLDYSSKIGA